MSSVAPALKPRWRAATAKLAARRLTSHSQWAGMGLVEIVHVEDEISLGRRKTAEIHQVGVAADGLHQPGIGRGRKIVRLDRRAAAVERERRLEHAAVAERDQLLDPAPARRLQQRDRIALYVACADVRGAGRLLAQRAPLLPELIQSGGIGLGHSGGLPGARWTRRPQKRMPTRTPAK